MKILCEIIRCTSQKLGVCVIIILFLFVIFFGGGGGVIEINTFI